MRVGLHPNQKYGRLGLDSAKFREILIYNKIDHRILSAGDIHFWKEISDCNFFIFQWTHHDYYRQIARSIIPVIENQIGIRCYPNSLCSWLYDDKIREYYILKSHHFPIVESWIFYDMQSALNFTDSAVFPMVFKLKSGAGSQMIRLVRNKSDAKKYIHLMFQNGVDYNNGLPGIYLDYLKQNGPIKLIRKKLGQIKRRMIEGSSYYDEDWFVHKNYILFQRFLPGNLYDTRVVVIGKQAFAFQRLNFNNDFRASGSNAYRYNPKSIDLEFIEIAFQVSKCFGFDSMAYDFLYDKNKKAAICEISYVFGSKEGTKISNCPGFWDKQLVWHEGKQDVAYCILSNFLNGSNLKMIPGHSGNKNIV